jgi:type VI secretion system protein VasJ
MDARELGSSPIQGDSPAGFDAKYEPEYADVSAEIGKLGSATQGGAVNWAVIAAQGQIILEQKSKDLQIAAYVGIAWQETRGIEGLRDAVHLFLGLLGTFWETAFPPAAKLRRRTNAFDWWHERACADLQKRLAATDTPALPRDMLDGLAEDLQKLDQLAGELMPDAVPLRDLLEAARRLPVIPEATAAATQAAVAQAPQAVTQTAVPQDSQAAPTQAEPQPAQSAPTPAQPATPTAASSPSPQPQNTVPAQAEPPAPAASQEDDAKAALKDFAATASRYAFLMHRVAPEDPLAWQVLRLALWSKVTAPPPAENGQTRIPPPDADHLDALRRMLETGKYLNAALEGEDLFATSIFCLDTQYLIHAALEGLGDAYAEARQRVREETARFVRRLKGVEHFAFDGGMPFAGQDTLDWLNSLNEGAAPASSAATPPPPAACATDELMTEAKRLADANQLGAALRLLEQAQGDSPAANMAMRARQLRLLCSAREQETASALAQGLLDELEARRIESWDVALALDVLLAAREAFSLAKDRDRAAAVHNRIARLRPSAALGWKR